MNLENVRAYLGALHNLGVVEDPMRAFMVDDELETEEVPWANSEVEWLVLGLQDEIDFMKFDSEDNSDISKLEGSLSSVGNVKQLAALLREDIIYGLKVLEGLQATLPKSDSLKRLGA